MRSRRYQASRPPTQIELFPFLSILACTIGTLILLIIVITTQTFSEDSQEVTIVARSEEGDNRLKSPHYIVCQADGVVVHPNQEFIPEQQIGQGDSALAELLAQIRRRRESEYLIVAVRPNGIEVFKKVRDLVEGQGIDIGYEPIDQDWELKIE